MTAKEDLNLQDKANDINDALYNGINGVPL